MPPQYLTPMLNMVMKKKPNVVLSQPIPGRLKRRDIIVHNEMYLIVYDDQPITIAIIDEQVAVSISPRYVNTVYSQYASAQNAADRLNREFDTDLFEVRTVRCPI